MMYGNSRCKSVIDQAEIHRMARSQDAEERKKAAEELKNKFAYLKDKEQAWEDLIRLTSDTNSNVRWLASDALWGAFLYVPDKKQAWSDLISLTSNDENYVRWDAAEALSNAFAFIPDKNQGWSDLILLTSDKDKVVRGRALYALGIAFSNVSDKKQAWNDLRPFTLDNDGDVRFRAVHALGTVFVDVPDKKQAWSDLHRLTSDNENAVRSSAADALGNAFLNISDKEQAWLDLHRLISDNEDTVRREAVHALGKAFENIPDKEQAWSDLHRLVSDNESTVRKSAAIALSLAFPYVNDKQDAWDDMCQLTEDIDDFVRQSTAVALGSAFLYITDKQQAWDYLIKLTADSDSSVRLGVAITLGSEFPFSYVPDKQKAWIDLIRLTEHTDVNVGFCAALVLALVFPHVPDKSQAWGDLKRLKMNNNSFVRMGVASTLSEGFPYVIDKKQAWDFLIELTQDSEGFVRKSTTESLGSVFNHVLDKKYAWNNLHKLSHDKDCFVRMGAGSAIGLAYSHIPDKKQSWNDLMELAKDDNEDVRVIANHSLGKVSILKASESESQDSFRKEIENALIFFEKASYEANYFNPTLFCLPFYRTFYSLMFKKVEAETEVQKYLVEAKIAIEGSKSKEILLEAVDNLGNAIKEVKNLRETDFDLVKANLNAYRRYCERACDLLDTTEEKAPGASKVIKKGLPIIDERIKRILAEIQEKAKALCKKTRGTSLEEMGCEAVKEANELSTSNELKLDISLEMMNGILNKFCEYVPADKRDHIIEDLKKAKYLDIQELFETTLKKLDEIYENFTIPPIITVPANKENKQKQDIVRIAAIQFGFKLTNSFPPMLEKKEECKQKIISSLDTAKSSGAHIVCLPELCMCEEWVQDIKDRYPDMIIIGGSYYKNDFNQCPVIMNLEVPPQLKKSPSRHEDPEITGKGMKSGDKLYRYETYLGTFSVLLCIDFLNYARFCDQSDIIFCPSYNEAKGIERFHEYANSHVTNTPSYIIISNTALFGGTSIFGQFHKDYYGSLVENGCKKSDDDSYKVCDLEKGFEGIIIADFDLVHKSSQVPTPADSNKVIKSIKNIKKINIS